MCTRTIYLAGGCFWGTQKFFDQFDGVLATEVGYANGPDRAPSYQEVCASSGHAETVRVDYDPAVISLTELLNDYFMVIDPLSVNRQGNDRGIQYRTGIYYTAEDQLPEIEAVCREQEEKAGAKLAVEVEPLTNFFAAEEEHQKYLEKNPGGYCHVTKVELEEVRDIIERQIEYNMAISEAGLSEKYGASIGKILMNSYGDSVQNRAKAYAAAGSDARMNGCELPVVINSGSGNQGITSSVPVIVYGRARNKPKEEILKALAVSNLVTIHLKTGIGRLSAYCGAVSAGCGAGAGIAYMQGKGVEGVAHTVVNALAVDSGIVCDGAKASCAAKISMAVEAGLMGLSMYSKGNNFFGGDGLVKNGVENTIDVVGRLARFGMKETDEEIIRLMLED